MILGSMSWVMTQIDKMTSSLRQENCYVTKTLWVEITWTIYMKKIRYDIIKTMTYDFIIIYYIFNIYYIFYLVFLNRNKNNWIITNKIFRVDFSQNIPECFKDRFWKCRLFFQVRIIIMASVRDKTGQLVRSSNNISTCFSERS